MALNTCLQRGVAALIGRLKSAFEEEVDLAVRSARVAHGYNLEFAHLHDVVPDGNPDPVSQLPIAGNDVGRLAVVGSNRSRPEFGHDPHPRRSEENGIESKDDFEFPSLNVDLDQIESLV